MVEPLFSPSELLSDEEAELQELGEQAQPQYQQ